MFMLQTPMAAMQGVLSPARCPSVAQPSYMYSINQSCDHLVWCLVAYFSGSVPPSLTPPQPPTQAPSGTQLPTQSTGGQGLLLTHGMAFLRGQKKSTVTGIALRGAHSIV